MQSQKVQYIRTPYKSHKNHLVKAAWTLKQTYRILTLLLCRELNHRSAYLQLIRCHQKITHRRYSNQRPIDRIVTLVDTALICALNLRSVFLMPIWITGIHLKMILDRRSDDAHPSFSWISRYDFLLVRCIVHEQSTHIKLVYEYRTVPSKDCL